MPSAVKILVFGDFDSAEPRTFPAHPPGCGCKSPSCHLMNFSEDSEESEHTLSADEAEAGDTSEKL